MKRINRYYLEFAVNKAGLSRYQVRRAWQKEEARARNFLRPLRNKVNSILKKAGIPKAFFGERRIKGTGAYFDAGWETESMIFGQPMYVEICIHAQDMGFRPSPETIRERDAVVEDYFNKALKALKEAGCDFWVEETLVGKKIMVYPTAEE